MGKELKGHKQSSPHFVVLQIFTVWVCTYHLSRCMLTSFSGSFGGNMVGRICVWRLLGTSDQSEYHWPSLVISYRDNSRLFKCVIKPKWPTFRTLTYKILSDFEALRNAHLFSHGLSLRLPKTKRFSTFQEVTPGIHFSPGRSAELSASSSAPGSGDGKNITTWQEKRLSGYI